MDEVSEIIMRANYDQARKILNRWDDVMRVVESAQLIMRQVGSEKGVPELVDAADAIDVVVMSIGGQP